MHSFEHPHIEQDNSEDRFTEYSKFIENNYSKNELANQHIIETALDGFEVLERRNKNNELIGLLTYTIGSDNKKQNYCALGVIVIEEDGRGDGLSDELFAEIKSIANAAHCTHISAKAETSSGKSFLERIGFEETTDPVNHQEYYRFDLE
ncbi:MAG TPA: GNAT family N-acetyltransferase [Candidatus Udaeobacter sp.]|nr:GNAT family N-acetyltransferase [Candidatus Udaeobacter sp.]